MRVRIFKIKGGERMHTDEFIGQAALGPTVGQRFTLSTQERYVSTSPVTEVRDGEFTTRSGSVYGFNILSELN